MGTDFVEVVSGFITKYNLTSTSLLPANEVETIKVSPGEQIAVLRIGGSDGELYVTELSA